MRGSREVSEKTLLALRGSRNRCSSQSALLPLQVAISGPVESPRLCYDRIVSIFRLKNNSYKGDFRSCLMILPNLRYLHPTSEDHCSGQVPGGQGPFFSIFFVLIQSEGLSSNNNEQPNTVSSALPFSLNPHKQPMR